MSSIEPYLSRTRIAYFSMEIGLRPEIRTYSGGLGVLAGDVARSASDLELPMVFVTLVSHDGYLRQDVDAEGNQIDRPDPWDLSAWALPLPAMIAVTLEGRDVWIRPWLYELASPLGTLIPVIFLDTRVDQNDPADRAITDRLYSGNDIDRMKQEVVLGVGGERILRALGFSIETYHLNEGHAAFLAVSLLRRYRREYTSYPGDPSLYDIEPVRKQCVFTTHTPVEAGHDRFPYADVERVLNDFIEMDQLKLVGGEDSLNMTLLALNLSGYVNGVARQHAETTRHLFPGYRVRAVTNGVHVEHWTHPAMAIAFHRLSSNWCHEPEVLSRADQLDDDAVWAAHLEAKSDLVTLVRSRTGVALDPALPIVGFARRMTGYKRPGLLFENPARLSGIHRSAPFQVVAAGKAHPRDESGLTAIREIVAQARRMDGPPVVFLPDYDMRLAGALVAGCDIWLNTPLPPLEASGTSGMKAALNGVLNFSILDGWWIEGCIEGVTGWSIDHIPEHSTELHAEALYSKLESVVLKLYREDRGRWAWMMKQAISKLGPIFNSQRMMRRYASEAYLR